MSQGIMKKFSSVLGFDDTNEYEYTGPVPVNRSQFKITVSTPTIFEDVQEGAKALLNKSAVLIYFNALDSGLKCRIIDYMNGVGYATNSQVERVSEDIVLYVPENVTIETQTFLSAKPSKWF